MENQQIFIDEIKIKMRFLNQKVLTLEQLLKLKEQECNELKEQIEAIKVVFEM
jgi:uncharacterized protein YfkK (UPF0435 family)